MGDKFLVRLFGLVAMLVTTAWLIGYLVPIWQPDFKPAPELNIVMMAVVGIFTALWNKARDPREPDQKDDDNAE